MSVKSIGFVNSSKSNSANSSTQDAEHITTKSKERNSLDFKSATYNTGTNCVEDNSEESFLSYFIRPLKHSMGFLTNQLASVSYGDNQISSGENNGIVVSSKPNSHLPSHSKDEIKANVLSNISRKMQKFRTSKCAEEIRDLIDVNIFSHLNAESKEMDIVCYGIGSLMDESVISINQLCVLLLLKEILSINLNGKTFIYDPAFCKKDKEILSQLGLCVIDHNERGKRHVTRKTLFFTPCVDIYVVSNILWANWGLSLSNVILLGNSISEICKMKKHFKNEFHLDRSPYRDSEIYFERILPFSQEFPMTMTGKYLQMDDLCYHCFPLELIAKVPEDLWRMNEEYHTPNKELKDRIAEISTNPQIQQHT